MFSKKGSILILSIMLIVTGVIQQVTADTEANKALVRRLYEELFNAKNLDVIDEIFATDYISNTDIHGPEGVKQFIEGFFAAFPDIQSTIENLIADGDKVVARVAFKGTHQGELMGIPPTEKQVTMTAIVIFRIADGKIVEEWAFVDFLGMMQQFGVIAPGRPSPENYLWSAPSAVTGDPGSPEENKAIALRAVEELWNQHNVDLVDEFFAADFIGHNPVLSGMYPEVGTESMKQAITDHFTAFPDFHVTVHDTLAERDKLAQLWTVTGTHKGEFMGIPPSGNQVTFAGITISRFADGKIVEQWWCYDALGMMQQITPPAVPETEANKALIQRMADAVGGKDKTPELIDEFFADEEMKQHVAILEAAFPAYALPFEDILAEGDEVVIRATFLGTHKGELMGIAPTGKDVTMPVIVTYRIANEKVVESWISADELGLMQQIGAVTPGRPAPENYVWDEPSDVTGAPGAPEENKAIVHRVIQEFWNQKNVEVLDETHSPDSLAHNPAISASYPYPQTFHVYKEACLAYLTGLPDLQIVIDDTIAEGDKVALRWTATGTHKDELMGIPATDAQVEFSGTTLYRFADGKIVDTWWAWDALGLMQQLTAPTAVPETEANRALFLRYADEIVSQGKMEVMDEIIAEDFVHRGAGVVDAEGIEGNKALIAMLRTAFPDLVAVPEDVIAEGDKVVILTTYTGTHQGDLMGVPPTGVAVTFTGICIARAADGKLAEIWTEYDVLGLMQQLGVVTPGRPPEYYAWSAPLDVTGDPGDPVANKALVMRFIDQVWNQQNLDVLDEIFAADVLGHNPPIEALYGPGIENLRQSVTDYITAFPDIHATVDDMVAEGDKVVARWTVTGTHQGELMGIPPSGKQVTWTGHTIYRIADGKIVEMWWAWDTMGMMQQLTALPEKDFSNVFFMSLEQGLNMISPPLEPVVPYTARSFAEEIGATVVIRYDTTLGKFVGFTLSASDDGFTIEGGEGYIVNVLESKVVPFTGAAWTNEPSASAAPPAQISDAWAFVVSGSVLEGDGMSAVDDSYTVIVRNLRTGDTFTESVDSSGYFAVAWADLSRKAVIGAGDQVEATVVDSSGEIVSGPFIHDIKLDEIRNAVANLHLELGEIIPEKTELLQNYPNPFNPETWIPYHLQEANPVVIRIHNTSGQLVRTLDLGHRDAGIYASQSKAAYWDGRNEAGEEVASGLYFYSITAGDFSATRKMIVKK